jgi:hypothetical protein
MSTYSVQDFHLAEQFVAIVLGMDQFYRSLPSASKESSFEKEGLVPINLTKVAPIPIDSWSEAISELEEIYHSYSTEANEIRRNYMLQQISSVITLAKWLSGEILPYRQLVRQLLCVNENPLTSEQQQSLHQRLDVLLSRKGYEGDLRTKVEKWEGEKQVNPGQLEQTLIDLLVEARSKTVQLGFAEVTNVSVTPKVVYDVPYNAYCDFLGQKMYINGDLSYTYESLKHLVTHEAFPGHTTHMVVRQRKIESEEIPLDAGLVITNTASSPTFEGIGDNGLRFLKWNESLDDEIYELLQNIRSICGLNAAHMVHVEQKNRAEVEKFMASFAFREGKWVESRWRFITHPFRAPFIYGYWRGNEAVHNLFSQLDEEEKLPFVRYLFDHMHSVDTLKQFVWRR